MKTAKSILYSLVLLSLSLLSTVGYARHAAILVEADTGHILNEVDATRSWYPASLTKVMTLYMAFTALNQQQINLNDSIVTTLHAAQQPNSKLGLRTGETITVQEAILAIITRSANDAAVALGEHLGGNEENFAMKMTAKAHAIGMFDSHFMNATGLPHPWQVTNARDMALLAWRVMHDFPQFYSYFSAHSFYFRGRELRGINKFTASYPGAEGMKTGFTCGSGYNLMSSAKQNDRRLIGVVLGGQSSAERYKLMTQLMDNGFSGKFTRTEKLIVTIPSKSVESTPYLLDCGDFRYSHSNITHENSFQEQHLISPRSSKRVGKLAKFKAVNNKKVRSVVRHHFVSIKKEIKHSKKNYRHNR